MPIIVDHSGNPLFAGLGAAAEAGGAAIQGMNTGAGGLNDMLMRLAQAQITERHQAAAFARDKEMAEFQNRLSIDRSATISDRERREGKQDAQEARDREMQEAAELAVGIGGEYNQLPPVGLSTKDDVHRWAAGLRIDKHRAKDEAAQERQYGKRRADQKADQDEERRREADSVGRVGQQLINGFSLMPQPQSFDELKAVYGGQQEAQRRADDKAVVQRQERAKSDAETRWRYNAEIERYTKAAATIDDQIRAAITELNGMDMDTTYGTVDAVALTRAAQLKAAIDGLRKQAANIAQVIANMPPPPAPTGESDVNDGGGGGGGSDVDSMIMEMVARGMNDSEIEAALAKRGVH